MADLAQLENALRNAHNAGDTIAAQRLAQEIQRQRRGVPGDFEEVGKYRGGTIYREPSGQLSFTSPGYSTTDQGQIQKMMKGLKPNTPDVGTGEGVARSSLQGASFYAGDEAVAAGAAALHPLVHGESGTDFSQRYDAYLGRERAKNERFKETHPKTALAAEITGGVVGAGTAGGAGATFMKGAKGAKDLAVRGAADGMLYGAVAGTGQAEGGVENRVAGAGVGAGVGGVTGGVAAPALAGVSALGRGLIEKVRRNTGSPERQAVARLRQTASRAGVTADDISSKLDDLGPDGMLVDALGEDGRALARTTANLDPAARETLELASKGRMSGQPDRLSDALKRASGLDQAYTTDELQRAVRSSMKPQIDDAYAEARSLGYDIDMGAFDDIFKTDVAKGAHIEGQRLARDRMIAEAARAGQVDDSILKNGPSNFDILDETKRSLDARAAPALGQPQTNEQSIAGSLSKTIRDRIDEYMPEYGDARELARTRHQREDAIALGAEGAKSRVPADFRRRVQEVNPAHKSDVGEGYAAGKIDQIENRRGTPGLPDTLFGSSRQQDALSAALGDKAAEVRRQIAAERTFGQTHAALTGNSTTARQLAEMGGLPDAGLGLAAADMGTGALAAVLARRLIPGAARNMSSRNDAAVAPVLADLLKGRELPENAVKKIQQSPALQRLIMRSLAQQGGAAAGSLAN
ncbi:MAG: hypothetical protein JJ979_05800 [Roseibium sp.]|nr:hypothetical protein [Roseibium sp.]